MCRGTFSACGGSRKRHSSIPPQCDLRGAFIIVWKRSFLYDNKDARISPDTSQFVFLPYLRLPVNARNQLLCIIGHSSFICLKLLFIIFCLPFVYATLSSAYLLSSSSFNFFILQCHILIGIKIIPEMNIILPFGFRSILQYEYDVS